MIWFLSELIWMHFFSYECFYRNILIAKETAFLTFSFAVHDFLAATLAYKQRTIVTLICERIVDEKVWLQISRKVTSNIANRQFLCL